MKKVILTAIGTRPEVIKMAVLIDLLNRDNDLQHKLCITGQHKELLYQALDVFKIPYDYDLKVMTNNQSLADITAKILLNFSDVLKIVKPDLVLVHGDTTTSFACALAAFYQQIPVGHVEAGLRTKNKNNPFPEEANRTLTAQIASLHFSPTELNKNNLINEGIITDDIYITGNTVIDTLLSVSDKIIECPENLKHIKNIINGQFILITGHRRENFGQGFKDICEALKLIAKKYPKCHIIYPVHLNPNVKTIAEQEIGNIANINLISPLDYFSFVFLMKKCALILTDSGGVQEEAPSLNKPVLVMREYTERTEALAENTIKLVGTNIEKIIGAVSEILDNPSDIRSVKNPYGDGKASLRILNHLHERLI